MITFDPELEEKFEKAYAGETGIFKDITCGTTAFILTVLYNAWKEAKEQGLVKGVDGEDNIESA